MKRIRSGIEGLDKLIDGGIPEGYMVLVSGPVGAGKTVFGLQFLCRSNEKGLFVSFEEDVDRLRETAKSFGWEIEKLEKEKKIHFLKYDPYKFEDILELLENSIRETSAKRVVLDSISALGAYVHETPEIRRLMLQIGNVMRKLGCASIIISEIENPNRLSRFGIEEFVSDGVIAFRRKLSGGEYKRYLSIVKMRSVDHSRKLHAYDMAKNGIVVK